MSRVSRMFGILALTVTTLVLFTTPGQAASGTFENIEYIGIRDNTTAAPYGSPILVTDIAGRITSVTVTLHALRHTNPDDMDVLLVGPDGTSTLLMSDAGGGTNISNVTLTFADSAPTRIRDSGRVEPGTYRPSDFGGGDAFPSPAPSAPYGSKLSAFKQTNPLGVWTLYVLDDKAVDTGSVNGGWSLTLETADSPTSVFVPEGGVGAPYPSSMTVSGMTGFIQNLSVTFHSISHFHPGDLDIVLVGPSGQHVVLMSDAGSTNDLMNATLTFDDSAQNRLPMIDPILDGTYRPTNYFLGDVMPSPAPAPAGGAALSVFNGTVPNGVWQLFVYDDVPLDGGSIGRWSLDFETGTGPALNPILAQVAGEGSSLVVQVAAIDPDGDPLTLTASNLPAFATLTDNGDGSGSVQFDPNHTHAGRYPAIRIHATADGDTDTQEFALTVNNVNQAPVANAGPDQTVSDDPGDGTQQVTLDGSASSDPDAPAGSISSYSWKKNGTEIATGVNPTVNLALGRHTISLRVVDNEGAVSIDEVEITVADTTAPTTTATLTPRAGDSGYHKGPVAIRLRATDNTGGVGVREVTYRATGATTIGDTTVAGSIADLNISSEGETTLTYFATDKAGNVETSNQRIVRIDSTAPVPGVPNVAILTPQRVGAGTPGFINISVSWSGSDSASGVKRYRLEQSTNGGSTWSTIGLATPLTTSIQRKVDINKSYAYRILVEDIAGNSSDWGTPRSFNVSPSQESDAQIAYTGSWTTAALGGTWGGSVAWATTNASATFTFEGTSVAFVSRFAADRGKVRIVIDGVGQGVIDLYSPTTKFQELAFVKSRLAPGSHTLKIVVQGQRHPDSTSTRVDLDGFIVLE